jgi:hypothetical protein
MPSFVHPALLWGLAAMAIPVLIHLINMMRHRKVEWAAMEFLLASQKKNRNWVIFKQLLLLLLRMLAVAAVALLVAQPLLHNQWGNLLGRNRTHHIILLDDSFSMSDRWADTDAFKEAKKVIQRIGTEAARQGQLQSCTLLRFSRLGQFKRATEPDLLKASVGANFADELEGLLAKIKVSQTAAGPLPALQAVAQLLGDKDGDRRILYLLSDFRAPQWNDPADLRKEMLKLNELGMEIHLIHCVDRQRSNLAIASLLPAEGIRPAGVPWSMEVAVQNFGSEPVRDVSVTLGEDGHGRPSVSFGEIFPGKIAKKNFEVRFPQAGQHEISARLEGDAVEADNHRFFAIDIPADLPVLLIDGDAQARDARYLSFALAPGASARTGLRPQIESPRYLSVKPLDNFLSVNLTNIERLDVSAVDALEKYVAAGGGAVFFLGEKCQTKFFNDVLYRDGKGLFPIPLAREMDLQVDRLEPAPDLQVEPHFIFAKQNSYLPTVRVERYFAVPEGWRPPPDSTVRVAARLRNGAPLVVERSFGKGRVLAFLTTAAPTWNNWALNPSFVVSMQQLQAYLSQRLAGGESRVVGSPLELSMDPAVYQPQVQFTFPEDSAAPEVTVNATKGGGGMLTATLPDTDLSGVYGARLTRADGTAEIRRYAINVDPAEGDLATLGGEQLATRLEGVKYQYEQAAMFQSAPSDLGGHNLAETLLYFLIFLLIGEQILAWSASYHPSRRRPLSQGDNA